MSKNKSEQPTSFIIPKDVHARLKVEAKKQDLSISQLVRRILQGWFDFNSKNKGNVDGEEK